MSEQLAPNQLDYLRPLLVKAMSVLGFALYTRPTPQEIKEKYRALAVIHHPDKGGNENKMKEVVAAYELLIGKTTLKIPAPQWPIREWVCIGTYGAGAYSTGTTASGSWI